MNNKKDPSVALKMQGAVSSILFFTVSVGAVETNAILVTRHVALGPFIIFSAITFWIYYRTTRTKLILVWLRRFHQKQKPGEVKISKYLEAACGALCNPVTIQDSTYKMSITTAMSSNLFFFVMYFWLLLFLMYTTVIGLSFLSYKLNIDNELSRIMAIAGIILVTIVTASLFYNHLKRHGFVSVSRYNFKNTVVSFYKKLLNKMINSTGIHVFKCDDDIWQETVKYSLEVADCVVIDVSDITESIIWELQTIKRYVDASRVIIAYSAYKENCRELAPDINECLSSIFGDDNMKKLTFICCAAYEKETSVQKANFNKSIYKKLKQDIINCLYSSNQSSIQGHSEEERKHEIIFNGEGYQSDVSEIDLSGETFPYLAYATKREFHGMKSGEILNVISTDPETEINFKLMEKNSIFKILKHENLQGKYHYMLEKV